MSKLETQPIKIALVGNPNVGKSVIFGFFTGRYATVSNYPGTTIEIARGDFEIDRPGPAGPKNGVLIDTPGVNTLIPMTEEEEVTRDILFKGVDGVIQVADAKNLRRALLVSLELSEMEIPFALTLNMKDEADSLGIEIDKDRLASSLGVPVISTVAIEKKGLKDLKNAVGSVRLSLFRATYPGDIEEAIEKIGGYLTETGPSKKSLALMILAGDKSIDRWLPTTLAKGDLEKIEQIRRDLSSRYASGLSSVIHGRRLKAVDLLMASCLRKETVRGNKWQDWIGHICLHPVWGFVVLCAVLFLFYQFVGKFGAQTAVGWLEEDLFGNYLNPAAIKIFSKIFFFSPFLKDLFVGPYGMITMALTYAFAIIFPIVLTFFIAFSLLEDSGYLPRLAILLNKAFKIIGLNGKAVVPMILGLGCGTMAVMTGRIMDTKKEKIILTLLLALAVPCSAQLGIILAMLSALPFWATSIWLLVVLGSFLVVGFLAAKILPGRRSNLILEIPPIRKPTLFNIMAKTVARLEWYLKEVVPLFVLGTLILFLLDRFQLLARIEHVASPLVVRFLDLPPKATEAFLIGFLRRDYGATRFFDLFRQGNLDVIQTLVSLIVITLFIPCLANLLMIVKERGNRVAMAMVGFIYPFAFLIGGIVNFFLRIKA
ncbi:MAG: ferrous iron transport protein B [Deltaproteobacteria bacterium]|nr:ferrous iron transport protein B [Deltaproteobacteria bacterium]